MSESTTRRTAPMARRILMVTLAGGVIVAIVASVLALPLVRDVAREQARLQLGRAVEQLGQRPADVARDIARGQQVVGVDDRRFAAVRPGGTLVGPASSFVSEDDLAQLLRTGRLSSSVDVDGEEWLIEGRAMRPGIAAIGVEPARAVDEASAALLRRLALALLLGLAAAGTLAAVLSRTLSRSVSEAAGIARRLADGERGIPPQASSLREIDDMSRAITALDHALATSEGRQREFLLSVSHEIRTPLTALRGYAEAMADGAITEDDIRSTGQTLVGETERLDRFVADLLSLARLESDDFVLEPVDIEVEVLLGDLEAAWRPTLGSAGISLVVEGNGLRVLSDPMRLRQLLDGLVENAIRESPVSGAVRITASAHQEGVEIAVADEGPGLTDDDLAVAFDRGALHGRYLAERPVGTGLGLSIAQRLARRMDADLSVTSGPGGGSTFTLHLPIA